MLRVREKITSQNWRSDLVQVWLIRERKTTGIASYFVGFESEVSAEDGLKLRCENVKLFLREPLMTCESSVIESCDMMKVQKHQLQTIYDDFEADAAPYKADAACGKGCAFCCTDAGSVHITTLEGLVIRECISRLPRPRQVAVKKALAVDMRCRKNNQSSACPLLMKNRACMIYDDRPFACRRIYSLKVCSKSQHPVLSKQVMTLGDGAIRSLQQLDDNGYSGHLSYILHMLDTSAFLNTYLAGDYRPEEIMEFGKTYGILINRMVAQVDSGLD